MSQSTFKPEDMPILELDTSGTSAYEASRFLDSPQTISAYLAQSMACHDPQVLMKALAEVAKAQGVNKVAEAAGVNRDGGVTCTTPSERSVKPTPSPASAARISRVSRESSTPVSTLGPDARAAST